MIQLSSIIGQGLVIVSLTLLTGVRTLYAMAPAPTDAGTCISALTLSQDLINSGVLAELNRIDPYSIEPEHRVRSARYSILDFLSSDPKKNLAAVVPSSVMNAAQHVLAMIYEAGSREVRTPYARETVRIYSALSDGIPEVRGRRAVGQWQALESGVMTGLRNQADGLRAGVYPTLYKGPPGTGKSEISEVIPRLMDYWSKHPNKKLGMLTGTWVNLDQITDADFAGKYPDRWAFPTDASPVAVLPEQVRDFAVKVATDEVKSLIGTAPKPKFVLDSQSKEIRAAVLNHYEKLKSAPLTMSEMMAALDRHLEVRHVLVDESYTTIVDSQGQDIDTGTLFGSANPVNRAIIGTDSPASRFVNSTFGKANRKYLGLDEIMTNSNELLKMFLRIIESRRFGISGPSEEVDSVYVAFTNDVDYNKKIKEGHQALANRFRPVQLRGAVFPRLIEDLLYYSVQENLFQQKIAKNEEEPEPTPTRYNHKDAVPVPEHQNINQLFLGPEYRYRLILGQGNDQIYIAPHVGRFMASMVAATRFITNPEKANNSVPGSAVIGLNEFHDPIARLRAYHGESDMNIEAYFDMIEMGTTLGEGSSFHPGILSRNAIKWWSSVIEEARKPANKNTVTPSLVLEVFFKQMMSDDDKGGIFETSGNSQRLEWISLMERVRNEWLLKTLRSDVLEAYGHGNHVAHRAYFELLAEFKALDPVPGALTVDENRELRLGVNGVEFTYEGKKQKINEERLLKVAKIYKTNTGRLLNPMQIGKLIGLAGQLARTEEVTEELSRDELYLAVVEYYADIAVQSGQLEEMVRQLVKKSTNAPEAIRLEAENFLQNMWRKGYNEYSAVIAAKMVNEELRQKSPAKQSSRGG